jgi:YD repeat-containing protein
MGGQFWFLPGAGGVPDHHWLRLGRGKVSTTSPATAAAPNGATTSYTCDPAGKQLTATDPNGVTTTATYTPLGLTASVSYSGSRPDSADLRTQAKDPCRAGNSVPFRPLPASLMAASRP